MTIRELRNAIAEYLSMFFTNATIAWGKTNMAKPRLPFITLELGNVMRPLKPESRDIDGVIIGYYPSNVVMTLNLFTMGAEQETPDGLYIRENTAESDLIDFINFMNSEYSIQWCNSRDLYMRVEGSVQDLTTLTNDANWEYRAMVQINIAFTQIAVGTSGILSESSISTRPRTPDDPLPKPDEDPDNVPTIDPEWEENASGGGSQEIADTNVGYFTKVDVEYGTDYSEKS